MKTSTAKESFPLSPYLIAAVNELQLQDEGGGADDLPCVDVFQYCHVVSSGAALHGIKPLCGQQLETLINETFCTSKQEKKINYSYLLTYSRTPPERHRRLW